MYNSYLRHLCNHYGSKLVRVTEEYTSKTCTKCGHVHHKLLPSRLKNTYLNEPRRREAREERREEDR